MWEVRLDREVEKALRRMMPELRQRLLKEIEQLQGNPFPPGREKVRGRGNEWRLRVGDYRIIYRVDERRRLIEVSEVGHRREVYRKG
jgi:mRNA interferase RelE/StbE